MQGQKIVNYNGHGSVSLWRGNILTNSDAAAMTNSQKLSVFVMMTCLNGYFNDPVARKPERECDESERRSSRSMGIGSAVRAIRTSDDEQELYRLLFDGSGLTLGEATAKAKAGVSDVDVRRSWIYFGDPAMKLK